MSNKTSKPFNKFYHVSPYRLKYGTILVPNIKPRNFSDSEYHEGIYLSTSPNPHITIRQKAWDECWYVYEVEPIGKVYEGDWHDLVCERAEVIKFIGNARGLINKYKRGSVYKGYCRKVNNSGRYWRCFGIQSSYWPSVEIHMKYSEDVQKVRERINNPSPDRERLYKKLGFNLN